VAAVSLPREHAECPHKVMESVAYQGANEAGRPSKAGLPRLLAVLCRCDCHLPCPVGGRARRGMAQLVHLPRKRVAARVSAPPGRPARYKLGPRAKVSGVLSLLHFLLRSRCPRSSSPPPWARTSRAAPSGGSLIAAAVAVFAVSLAWMVLKLVAGIIALNRWS